MCLCVCVIIRVHTVLIRLEEVFRSLLNKSISITYRYACIFLFVLYLGNFFMHHNAVPFDPFVLSHSASKSLNQTDASVLSASPANDLRMLLQNST